VSWRRTCLVEHTGGVERETAAGALELLEVRVHGVVRTMVPPLGTVLIRRPFVEPPPPPVTS
jgi:hypothetical protein